MKKTKIPKTCDECKTNEAKVKSSITLGKFRKLCLDCYKKLLEEKKEKK